MSDQLAEEDSVGLVQGNATAVHVVPVAVSWLSAVRSPRALVASSGRSSCCSLAAASTAQHLLVALLLPLLHTARLLPVELLGWSVHNLRL